jgi:hypothetical protein
MPREASTGDRRLVKRRSDFLLAYVAWDGAVGGSVRCCLLGGSISERGRRGGSSSSVLMM